MNAPASAGPPQPPRYGVLVPVKRLSVAKSRLAVLGDELRRELVVAFALDTVEAALRTPCVEVVLAVTDDHLLAAELTTIGAAVVPDGVGDDLNGTLVQAALELHRRRPDLAPAALCADLPGLDPAELEAALHRREGHRGAFLPDAAGIGTTLVCAADVEAFRPCFGPDSSRTHREAGLHAIPGEDLITVRQDVDTPEDLARALTRTLGSRTRRVTGDLT